MSDKRWTLDPAIDDFLATMTVSEDLIKELRAERAPIEAASPNPGDAAPDFEAEQLSAEGQRTGQPLKLSSLRGRPVALQFGSYTCPVWRGQIDRFNEIYDELKGQFEFVTVYTREAHPEDGWQVDINHAQGVVYDQPTTADQRTDIAATAITRHGIEQTVLLDDMNDSINKSYSASPERLYLIDDDGVIRHKSVTGPFQMQAIEDWYAALKAIAAAAPRDTAKAS